MDFFRCILSFHNLKTDVFEKMKLTDLNSIRLQMIYNATTNNKAALEYLLDMFDDTEETWFPVCTLLKNSPSATCLQKDRLRDRFNSSKSRQVARQGYLRDEI